MRILELDIENVRGIKSRISLKPNGENLSIHGPNGSGKSAVVDGLDFLMTGDISRLTGKGTKGIALKRHGKHIDAKPEEAVVTAKVSVESISEPITLQRRISQPKELLIDPEVDERLFHQALEIAQRGQHVLSRAEILKYIAAEAGTRGEEIQTVLNLQEIEDLRKTFVTIKREADKEVQSENTNFERSMAAIIPIVAIEKFSEPEVLEKINENRKVLKGKPLDELDPNSLQEGVSPVAEDEKDRVDRETLKRTISEAEKIITEKGLEVYEKEKEIRETVQSLKADEMLRKDLANKRLIDLGISLIDDSGSCPLCLKPWEPGKLKEFLEERQSRAGEAQKIETKIRELSTEIDKEVGGLQEYLGMIQSSCVKLGEKNIAKNFQPWLKSLEEWSKDLKDSLENYKPVEELSEEIKTLSAPEGWEQHFKAIKEKANKIKKFTPKQQSWNTLTELKSALKRYVQDRERFRKAVRYAGKASTFEKAYNRTKDKVLKNLYDSVNQDFSTYYKYLHGEDEKNFYSELKSEGPHLDFKVDFYGRGPHNPRALHSEGHQDSMGLCLYLALNKKISEGKVKLVILDDVVMSIDSDHRRNVCKLLNKYFPDIQFIITTHNRTWARQLHTDGVVRKKNMIHFKGWSIDTGPRYEEDTDVWNNIQKKLDEDEVPSAAHMLREHSEFFYETVCDSLRSDVCYKSDGQWDLGDYLSGARKAYKDYLRQAKKSARSWENEKQLEEYEQLESQANEIIQRTQIEHWGINENVHYTRWKDSTKRDFLPITEAFQDFENLFRCPQCQGIIGVNMVGLTPTNIKCPCSNINWNLEIKK